MSVVEDVSRRLDGENVESYMREFDVGLCKFYVAHVAHVARVGFL